MLRVSRFDFNLQRAHPNLCYRNGNTVGSALCYENGWNCVVPSREYAGKGKGKGKVRLPKEVKKKIHEQYFADNAPQKGFHLSEPGVVDVDSSENAFTEDIPLEDEEDELDPANDVVELSLSEYVMHRLAGRWAGAGLGEYPGMDKFQYRELLEVVPGEDEASLLIAQKTRTDDDFIHCEAGVMKFLGDAKVEMMIGGNGGFTEILEGNIDPKTSQVQLKSTSVCASSSGRESPKILGTERDYVVVDTPEGTTLLYNFCMATEKTPNMTRHTTGMLREFDESMMDFEGTEDDGKFDEKDEALRRKVAGMIKTETKN